MRPYGAWGKNYVRKGPYWGLDRGKEKLGIFLGIVKKNISQDEYLKVDKRHKWTLLSSILRIALDV